MEWKKESGNGGEYRCDQKPFGPTIETFTGKHSQHNNEARKNCHQANQRMDDRIDPQDHLLAPWFLLLTDTFPVCEVFSKEVSCRGPDRRQATPMSF